MRENILLRIWWDCKSISLLSTGLEISRIFYLETYRGIAKLINELLNRAKERFKISFQKLTKERFKFSFQNLVLEAARNQREIS